MHSASFRAIGFDGTYGAFDVAPQDLPSVLRRFAAEGYRGINCTIPHKEAVLPLLDRLDDSAVHCAAANTVLFAADGTTTGYNTDGAGFRLSLEECGFRFAGARIVLLGAGGAARAVSVACRDAGCAELAVSNRTRSRAESLVAELRRTECAARMVDLGGVDDPETCRAVEEADLVVNATPLGLKPDDPSAVPQELLHAGQTVYDLIPVRRETATLAAARVAGARAVGGLGMLVHQGAAAFRIWTGLEPDISAMFSALGMGR